MNYGNIKYCDIANGEGVRTTLFVSGCTHCCRGCFQPETWDFRYGEEFTDAVAEQILDSLQPAYVDGLTVLGGEPMEPANQRVLAPFLEEAARRYPDKTIWLFTGDVYENLADPASPRRTEATDRLLAAVDVLVDGPFIEEQKDISLRFRGSANQRIIDMARTRQAGEVVPWQDDAVFAGRGRWTD